MHSTRWNHAICIACWDKQHPDEPAHDPESIPNDNVLEICCFCGQNTRAGIYVRRDPASVELLCRAQAS